MKINRSNYELFFLDYFDGKLSDAEQENLFVFLKHHPDLNDEFKSFELITLEEDHSVQFNDKDSLRKKSVLSASGIDESNFTNFFIAWHEGDLNSEEKLAVQNFLAVNPQLQDDFETFGQLKLSPEENIVFTGKDNLRHKLSISPGRMYLRYAASFAAVLILAFAGYIGLNYLQNTESFMANSNYRSLKPSFSRKQQQNADEYQATAATHYYINKTVSPEKRLPENIQIQTLKTAHVLSVHGNNINDFPQIAETLRNEFADIYHIKNERETHYEADNDNYQNNNESRLFDKVIDMVKGSAEDASQRISSVNGWQLAYYGVQGFNLLTDNDVEFRTKTNDQGEVSKVVLNDFAIPVNRNR